MNNAITDNIMINTTIDLLAPNTVICLMAPTASGKTALAYELYETGKFELISVDSALVYRDMNIGTAKPTADELCQYPHHLVDIIDPTQSYSVANFVADVEGLISDIHARGKIPLLIGGTMMYYMALFNGISNVPDSDARVRAEVEAWRREVGIEALHQYLKDVDPILGKRLNAADTQRITRAVEVYKQTGKPLSYWQNQPKIALADNPNQQWVGLTVMPDRAWIHKRIAQRLDIMWQQGLIAEVLLLIKQYQLTASMASMRCVGYRQVIDYLMAMSVLTTDAEGFLIIQTPLYCPEQDTKQDIEQNLVDDERQQDMRNKALYATRQLAKRQYTWLRKLKTTSQNSAPIKHNSNSNTTINSDANSNPNINATEQQSNNTILINFDSMSDAEQYIHQRI